MTQQPKAVRAVLLVKLDNGNVHSVLITEEYMPLLLEFGAAVNGGVLKIIDPPIQGVDF